MGIYDLKSDDFSNYGETMVGYKLKEFGWHIYKPDYDRYVDLIACKLVCKKCNAPWPDYNRLICLKCHREVSKGAVRAGKICPKCKKTYPPRTMTCDKCNIALRDNPRCPRCGGLVDIKSIACEKCNYKTFTFKFRTIQIKSSRVVDDGRNYGLTMKPKDLFDDPHHFFVWCFVDTNEEHKYLVLSVNDYKKIMGDSINTYSFRIAQNYRHHINKTSLREGNKNWGQFLNKFESLE